MSEITREDGSRVNRSLYKTELCRTWMERGECSYGYRCQYAHGVEDLRLLQRHPKYKTEPCQSFLVHGKCAYGLRCHFIHDESERIQPNCHNPSFVAGAMQFAYFYPQPGMPHGAYYFSQPMISGTDQTAFSTSFDSGFDSSSTGSDSGDLEPFTAGFMKPKAFIEGTIAKEEDFSPFDEKHEVLGSLLADMTAFQFSEDPPSKTKRLPVFTQLSPSKN